MTNPIRNVAVVAPSTAFNNEQLEVSIALLNSWGVQAHKAPNLYAKEPFTAGTVAQRIRDLEWAFSGDFDAVWSARGGYGCIQLLDEMPLVDLPIIGFSDATAMLNHRYTLGLAQLIHGPVLYSLHRRDESTIKHMREWLINGNLPALPLTHISARPIPRAPLVGGNLCMLTTLCGTPYQPNYEHCVVVIEDIAEPAYKIDRMLLQCIQAGLFDGIAGVLLGTFTDCSAPDGVELLSVITERLVPLGVPIARTPVIGHGQCNWPWKFGATNPSS